MPTRLFRCQGGISRLITRRLIDCAHGRASLYVSNDIGAPPPGRWHVWHFARKIGATSFANVSVATSAVRATVPTAMAANIMTANDTRRTGGERRGRLATTAAEAKSGITTMDKAPRRRSRAPDVQRVQRIVHVRALQVSREF